MPLIELSRRSLLRASAGVATAAGLCAWRSSAGWAAPPAPPERVLLVVELAGGNDGLSTVVPTEEPAYHRARKATRIAPEQVLALEPLLGLGLHPNLARLLPLYQQGSLALVLGAGYPQASRSHFVSMDIWHAASLRGRGEPSGWLGRALAAAPPGLRSPEEAVHVGDALPFAFHAPGVQPVSFKTPAAYRWLGSTSAGRDLAELQEAQQAGPNIRTLARTAREALASSQRVRAAAASYTTRVAYPPTDLARDLRTVAALLHAGLRTRVYHVRHGGYDTHADQRRRHDALMRALGDALAAFQADLVDHGCAGQVVTLVFSEFGRRVAENGSEGTDHGAAGPVLVLGQPVKGGCHGRQPSFARLEDGDLAFTTDFRRVYATLLERWLSTPSAPILGGVYEPLGFLA